MRKLSFFLIVAILLTALLPACRHSLIVDEALDVIPGDTIPDSPPDTADYTGVPCDPDSVYFANQILPLLNSSCAKSGCHDVTTHEEGLILSDYTNIMKKVKPGKPLQSKVYTALSASGDERMPPSPDPTWTQEQKDLLKKWIEQGALNNECNENYGGCNTAGVTYTNFIYPLFANQCNGCHSGSNPSGGLLLATFEQVKASAAYGKLYGAINHDAGYKPMPDGTAKLPACYISKVKTWIDNGMLH